MKRFVALALLTLFCSALFAGNPNDASKSNEGFEKLKSLVGTWKGTMPEGTVTLTYKLVSGGSVIMETNDSEKHKDGMITMYHLDGNTLMMTHYCSMGNQPRMRVSALTSGGKIAFTFVGGTNLAKNDAHMHALTMTFKDNNSMTQDWTMRAGGKDEIHTFELTRVAN
jgi:outer membrane lipoprotein-sorting protein